MGKPGYSGPLEEVTPFCWRIPKSYKKGMRVDGFIYASRELIDQIRSDQAPEQVANVAFLPGIQKGSFAMPDIHWGYGFPIGGVCATDPNEGGVISPGGVGYDINCGVRIVRTDLTEKQVRPKLEDLIRELFNNIPTGTGREGKYVFNKKELRTIMQYGPAWLVEKSDLGCTQDLEHTESEGCLKDAVPENVSDRAITRGKAQCGTLGSGNHFIEVQVVDKIVDQQVADRFELREGQICVMIHSGSRGLGHQVCTDYLAHFDAAPGKYGISIPDRQLACAPIDSPEGKNYIGAMRAAANYAWANRQLLMVQVREVFERVFKSHWKDLGMSLLYDVAHNIAKLEEHECDGKKKLVWVHRKGATRAFPAGHPEIPKIYRSVGQPVIIPGSMGTASWISVGQPGAMEKTFGSACHGAGRQMSRHGAVRDAMARAGGSRRAVGALIAQELRDKGIIAMARSRKELAEEQPKAYKDVDAVVEVAHQAGLASKVARLRSIGVIKG